MWKIDLSVVLHLCCIDLFCINKHCMYNYVNIKLNYEMICWSSKYDIFYMCSCIPVSLISAICVVVVGGSDTFLLLLIPLGEDTELPIVPAVLRFR